MLADGKRLRCGYTTGTCAAMAAAAACRELLTGETVAECSLDTPAGIRVTAETARLGFAFYAVRKDGGDDCDATHGALICARAEKAPAGVEIDGGEGVGRVTKPGLDQPVGAAAINTVPRRMAGLVYELAGEFAGVEISVVPGVTAALSGAAVLGAPLSHDFAVISLSDLLTPRQTIEKRLLLAAEGDFCIALYNPASHKRADYLQRACELLLRYKAPGTLCGWVRNIGREGQQSRVLTLAELKDERLDMVGYRSERYRYFGTAAARLDDVLNFLPARIAGVFMEDGLLDPALVIGVPVGFVNVVESKELILTAKAPYIVARGRKGGSNVAAAICNALLYRAVGRKL